MARKIVKSPTRNTKPSEKAAEVEVNKLATFKPLNDAQRTYQQLLESKQVVIATGGTGTGKSVIPIVHALELLEVREIDTIYITKPTVEVGQPLGYLPGEMGDKLSPYTQSMIDHFYDLIGKASTNQLITAKKIQGVPLGYMRGSNYGRSIIIADEMQNATLLQIKTILTRIKEDTQLVLTGDLKQCDLENTGDSGLPTTIKILKGLNSIGFVEFTEDDIVRSGIVKEISKAFTKAGY